MRLILKILFVFLAFSIKSLAQDKDEVMRTRSFSATGWQGLIGYSYQKGNYLEAGFGRNIYGHTIEPFFGSFTMGSEFYLNEEFAFAPKITARMMGGYDFGLSLLNYTNMKNNCVVLRPEIGVGLFYLAFGYGYNFKLSNTSYAIPGHHCFFLVVNLFKAKDRS